MEPFGAKTCHEVRVSMDCRGSGGGHVSLLMWREHDNVAALVHSANHRSMQEIIFVAAAVYDETEIIALARPTRCVIRAKQTSAAPDK